MIIIANDVVKYRNLTDEYQPDISYRKLQNIHFNSIFLHVLGYDTINPNFTKIMKKLLENSNVINELKKPSEFDVCMISNNVIDIIIKYNKINVSNTELSSLHKDEEIDDDDDDDDEDTSQRYKIVKERYKKAMKMYKDYCVNVLMTIDPKKLHISIISYYNLLYTDYINDLYFYEYEDTFSFIETTLNELATICLKKFNDVNDLDINKYIILGTSTISVLHTLFKKGFSIAKIQVKHLELITRYQSNIDSINIPQKFPKKFCEEFKKTYSLAMDDNRMNIITLLGMTNKNNLWRAYVKILISCKCITMIKDYIEEDNNDNDNDNEGLYKYKKKKFIRFLKKSMEDLQKRQDYDANTYVMIRNILKSKSIDEPGIAKKTMKYTLRINKNKVLGKLDAVLKNQKYEGRTPKSSSASASI